MRILLSSNAPWAPTGYGNQVHYLAPGLKAMGHDVAIQAWWGLEGGEITWCGDDGTGPPIKVFPKHVDAYGNDAAAYYCRTWKADLLITLIDLWVMDPSLGNLGPTKWCPLFPIDHADPLPEPIAARFESAHHLLVYSHYGERQVKAYADGRYVEKVRLLPHGIATDIYRPCGFDEKIAFRQKLLGDWPEDAFIVGMIAANKGYPCRKSFPEAIEAFALFSTQYPEAKARLYLHSNMGIEMGGPDLQALIRHFGVQDTVRLANPRLLFGGAYDDETMRQFYCCMDVLLSPSQGEGFGLPILEAQSCGVPVIVTDHSAMSENVGSGWRVPPLAMAPSLLWGKLALAHPEGVAHALSECYRRPLSSQRYDAMAARDFAVGYDWNSILPLWDTFLTDLDKGRSELALELRALSF